MSKSTNEVLDAIRGHFLGSVLRGEACVFTTPPAINDDMRPTDHDQLLERGLYPLVEIHGAEYVSEELDRGLREISSDALGVFCANQCFYIEMVREQNGRSPLRLDRSSLPKVLAAAFLHQSDSLHSLEFRPGDRSSDRSYKVTLSGMHILARDYGIDWGIDLPSR